jgi:hypothetical protein
MSSLRLYPTISETVMLVSSRSSASKRLTVRLLGALTGTIVGAAVGALVGMAFDNIAFAAILGGLVGMILGFCFPKFADSLFDSFLS